MKLKTREYTQNARIFHFKLCKMAHIPSLVCVLQTQKIFNPTSRFKGLNVDLLMSYKPYYYYDTCTISIEMSMFSSF